MLATFVQYSRAQQQPPLYVLYYSTQGSFREFSHDYPCDIKGYSSVTHFLACHQLLITLSPASCDKLYNNIVTISELINVRLSSRQAVSDIIRIIHTACMQLKEPRQCQHMVDQLLDCMWSFDEGTLQRNRYKHTAEGRQWLGRKHLLLKIALAEKFSADNELGQLLLATHSTSSRQYLLIDRDCRSNQMGLELMNFRLFLKCHIDNQTQSYAIYKEYLGVIHDKSKKSEPELMIPREPLLRAYLSQELDDDSEQAEFLHAIELESKRQSRFGISEIDANLHGLSSTTASDMTVYYETLKSPKVEVLSSERDPVSTSQYDNSKDIQVSVSREDPSQCGFELLMSGKIPVMIIVSHESARGSCYQELLRTTSLGFSKEIIGHKQGVFYFQELNFLRTPINQGYRLLSRAQSQGLSFGCVLISRVGATKFQDIQMGLACAHRAGSQAVVICEFMGTSSQFSSSLRMLLNGYRGIFSECHLIAPTRSKALIDFHYDQRLFVHQSLSESYDEQPKLIFASLHGVCYPAVENPFQQKTVYYETQFLTTKKLAALMQPFLALHCSTSSNLCVAVLEQKVFFALESHEQAEKLQQALVNLYAFNPENIKLDVSSECSLGLSEQYVVKHRKDVKLGRAFPLHRPRFPLFFLSVEFPANQMLAYFFYVFNHNPPALRVAAKPLQELLAYQTNQLEYSTWFSLSIAHQRRACLVELLGAFYRDLKSPNIHDKLISLHQFKASITTLVTQATSNQKYAAVKSLFPSDLKSASHSPLAQIFSQMLELCDDTLAMEIEMNVNDDTAMSDCSTDLSQKLTD